MGASKKLKESKKEAKGRGPGKGKEGKKGRATKEVVEVEEEEEDDGADEVLTLLDVLWPKKEGLTLIKWSVHHFMSFQRGPSLHATSWEGPGVRGA